MLISGAFAKRHGFKIRREAKYRRWVELVDGSTIMTDGTVCGANLEFDVPFEDLLSLDHDGYVDFAAGLSSEMGRTSDTKTTTFICDLHVIQDLPCDIILSGEFIFKTTCLASSRVSSWTTPRKRMKVSVWLLGIVFFSSENVSNAFLDGRNLARSVALCRHQVSISIYLQFRGVLQEANKHSHHSERIMGREVATRRGKKE